MTLAIFLGTYVAGRYLTRHVCHQCTLGLARGDRCDTREETYICFQGTYEYLSEREERCDANR